MTDKPIPYTVSELTEFSIYLDLCTTFRPFELVRDDDEFVIITHEFERSECCAQVEVDPVSYTHLTLPTIYSV